MKSQRILVGVCGGVAAYKAVEVVSSLRKQGHRVRVAMTEAAKHFVAPDTFAAVSGEPVLTGLWADPGQGTLEDRYPHLYPATQSDLFLLLPATANTLGQIAHGLAPELVSTCALSLPKSCLRVFCPAMNVEMWENAAVQANVATLEAAGWKRLGPESGHLACGMTGAGRMREPADILRDLQSLLDQDNLLAGKKALILSGPTREHFDPIRYIGNPSSGKMGQALAHAVARHGASVDFVSGPVPEANLPHGENVRIHKVVGATEMLAKAREFIAGADALLYVAAVADYRPETRHADKLPKHNEAFDIRLVPNPDLAATLNLEKKPGALSIGFALQTKDGEAFAREKLLRKGLDGIVLNYADSLGSGDGRFSFLGKTSDDFEDWGRMDKALVAEKIVARILL